MRQMSGHSHWSGIKFKKAAADKKRGKLFSKVSKRIMSAARRGGADISGNIELQAAVEEAKAANMPKDKIERAILKGAGQLPGEQLEAVRYEGYGRGGAAVMVDALTDNRNRTSPDVRRVFEDCGGKLGASGCVAWHFRTKGLILVAPEERGEEELLELAAEAGAEDFENAGDLYEVTCEVGQLNAVKTALLEAGVKVESAEITEVPGDYVDLSVKDAEKVLAMMEKLENLEDVVNIYSNFNLPPELVERLAAQ